MKKVVNKSSRTRSDMVLIVAVVIGLVVGSLVKRVRLGIVLGLLIGGSIVFLSWIKFSANGKRNE